MRSQSPRLRGDDRPRSQQRTTYPLPHDSRILVHRHINRCPNYSLRIDRLLLCNERTWELAKQAKERQGVRTFQGEAARLIGAHKARWEALLASCRQCGYEVKSFSMRTDGRVTVGLGAESVLETSIRLHRVYGFPIIPGSALKGLARSYAELVEDRDESDETFAAVFGKSPPDARAGQVIFFDAIPANPANLKLELDVMNPHYSQYYQGGTTPPADYLNPVPVPFLTIAPGSEFLFAVASPNEDWAHRAQAWLKAGLQEMGIGGKTTAGYGLWR